MKVTKALAEIKKLDKRMVKLSNTSQFIAINHKGYVMGFNNQADAIAEIKASMQQVLDLKARRALIKGKLTASNAATKITVAGTEMSVAEALERKKSIDLDKEFLQVLKNQLDAVNRKMSRNQAVIEGQVAEKVNLVMGNVKKIDSNDTTVKTIQTQVENANKMVILDPNGLASKISQLEQEIEDFETSIDIELSISNATTSIDVQ